MVQQNRLIEDRGTNSGGASSRMMDDQVAVRCRDPTWVKKGQDCLLAVLHHYFRKLRAHGAGAT